ncbi:MAG: radical SAM protein [Deltaproteobacteria bacterium]|nr:MAG: radical SAM protein [Deltaproteobacteria bacterium]
MVVACYELGRPPHGVALAAAALSRAGWSVRAVDLSVDRLDDDAVHGADAVAIAVPMHTALRLGAAVGRRVRAARPGIPIVYFGSYAPLNEAYLRACGADAVVAGECESALVDAMAGRTPAAPVSLSRARLPVPRRDVLPPLSRYAKLVDAGGRQRLAGYTEATRGCLHMCRHCPIPPIYGGRLVPVDRDVVLADIAQQIAAGAEHISFGDPDFWCGPGHAMRILRDMHDRWPGVSFDATIKIEHLLRHAALLPELRRLGCAFVVSAVEAVDDRVLAKLAKGHTRADVDRALALAREAGVPVRPTFVPFTPWIDLPGLLDLLDFIESRDLVGAVDPVQLTVRLLVPPGSLLADEPEMGPVDAERLTHVWTHRDERVDALQRRAEAIVAAGGDYAAVRAAYYQAAGVALPPLRPPERIAPRMTEPWFC